MHSFRRDDDDGDDNNGDDRDDVDNDDDDSEDDSDCGGDNLEGQAAIVSKKSRLPRQNASWEALF